MKEKEFLSIIEKTLNSDFIGDDCAYLADLGIVVTHDSLIENIHFNKEYITPYELGYKSVMVNLSDIAASGSEAKYLTIALSLPNNTEGDFIEEFYAGCKCACGTDIKIVGGDITGADKICVSICAIGSTKNRNISSRKNAIVGQKVVVSGVHGSSAAGLRDLLGGNKNTKFVKCHLMPVAQLEFGDYIAKNVKQKYAMMDTSDGLADALSTIANESNVLLNIDFNKIPYDPEIISYKNWQDIVLFGGEDYQIVATIPENINFGHKIGTVELGLGLNIKYSDKEIFYTKEAVNAKIFNHFD